MITDFDKCDDDKISFTDLQARLARQDGEVVAAQICAYLEQLQGKIAQELARGASSRDFDSLQRAKVALATAQKVMINLLRTYNKGGYVS